MSLPRLDDHRGLERHGILCHIRPLARVRREISSLRSWAKECCRYFCWVLYKHPYFGAILVKVVLGKMSLTRALLSTKLIPTSLPRAIKVAKSTTARTYGKSDPPQFAVCPYDFGTKYIKPQ